MIALRILGSNLGLTLPGVFLSSWPYPVCCPSYSLRLDA